METKPAPQAEVVLVLSGALFVCWPAWMLQVVLPGNSSIFTGVYSYQRDPDYWPEALEFKPERFLPVGAQGGAGAGACIMC